MTKIKLLLAVSLIITTACKHTPKTEPVAIQSADGRLKAKQIKISDPYGTKIDKLLKSAYINYKNIDFNKAITNFETAKLINNGDLDFWHDYTLAYCYMTTGKLLESRKILEQLIEDKPEIAESYVLLSYNFFKLKRLDSAIDFLNKAVSLETHAPTAYYYLSMYKKIKNPQVDVSPDIKKATEEYEKILVKNPHDFETLLEYTNFLTTFGELTKARVNLEKAKAILDISPEVEEITYQESLAPYQNPIWSSFYINMVEGIILNKEGHFLASNQLFLIALQTPPSGSKLDIAEIYFFMNRNFRELKNLNAANNALKMAVELDPTVTSRFD